MRIYNNLQLILQALIGSVILELLANTGRASAAGTSLRSADAPKRKPNLLFVIADDMARIFGDYTNRDHPLNDLSDLNRFTQFTKESTTFDGVSSYPVCAGSRMSILTGRNPDKHKIYTFERYEQQIGNGNITTLPGYLTQSGYTTLADHKVYHPCTTERNTQIEYLTGQLSFPILYTMSGNGVCGKHAYCAKPKQQLFDVKIANSAINFLKKMAATPEQPWGLFVGFKNPHTGIEYPTDAFNRIGNDDVDYSTPKIPGAPDFLHSLAHREYDSGRTTLLNFDGKWEPIVYGDRNLVSDLFTPKYKKTVQLARRAYNAAIYSVLEQFDRILKALDENGFSNNTIIVQTSDHGYAFGERLNFSKNGLGKRETEVPLIIHTPGQKIAYHNKYPTGNINIYCTVIDLIAGEQALKNFKDQSGLPLNCRSLRPALTNINYDVDQGAISQYPRCQKAGSIQVSDCMTGPRFTTCLNGPGRDRILYMGYTIQYREDAKNTLYKFTMWHNFFENRTTCKPATWPNMPANIKQYGAPVWQIDANTTKTIWNEPSMQHELYSYADGLKVGDPGYYSSNNLAYEPNAENAELEKKYENIIKNRMAGL